MASLIVAGSTGAIGRTIVQHAARNKNISRIIALTRSGDTARENYPKLFGIYPAVQQDNPNSNGEKKVLSAAETSATAALQKNEVRLTEEEMAKIVPVTFDWDFFLANWQQLKRCYNFLPANGDATSASWLKLKEGNAAMVTVAGEGSNEKKKERHSTGDGPGTAKVGLPMAAQLARWRDIFAGHTYCAMALGTTRADAGSADNFIRCDYDCVIAFTEAMLCFSAPGGFPFDGRPREPKGFAAKQRPISTNEYFLYNIGDKASPVKPTAKGTDGATITFAEAFPRFKTVLPETVFMSAASTESGKADGAEVALSSRTLRRFCQISAYNASKSSFLLYPKVKGAADAAVAERILYTNTLALAKAANKADDPQQQSGNNALVELSFVMPGLLERYEKTRGVEKFGKWVMSAIGVEKCGACAVANFIFDDKHLDGESASEDDLLVATASSSTRSNKHAFSFGTYYAAAAERQQVEANSNKMLFFWQGNAEIEKQAARLAACARDA